MTDKTTLSDFYRQELEVSIIEYLAEKLKIDLRDAMRIYPCGRVEYLLRT